MFFCFVSCMMLYSRIFHSWFGEEGKIVAIFFFVPYSCLGLALVFNLLVLTFRSSIHISRRYSPVRGQIYLLKIASIYGNFTPIGTLNVYFGVFLEYWACAKSYQIHFQSEKVCQKKTYLSNFLPVELF